MTALVTLRQHAEHEEFSPNHSCRHSGDVGRFFNSLGTVWTLNADGTFHVTAMKPKAEIWGKYTVASDTIMIQETRRVGSIPKSCSGTGVYKFSRQGQNTLAFVLVSDKCKPRMQNVTQPLHPK